MACSYSDETPVEGAWQKYWGTGFKWTSKHLTPQQLRPFIYSYDTIATEAIERLDEIVPPPEGAMKPDDVKKPRGDMYEKIKEYAIKDEKIGRLWSEVCTVPDWVDWGQIERGQKALFRYGGPAVIAVGDIPNE
ncbi:hypothetical protein NUW58_g9563 [Xylaria curta]|uniref:Uncharacterized protein n=1 Tax=Xylaria curta TaxID=42375 RepID=A0ACC1MV53_9PEZI|nr:hypothetical protein NUW58_g9563 [Xylaria curta]